MINLVQEKVVILGTGTCEVSRERTSSSVLIHYDDLNIVFDMGRGTTQRIADLDLKNDELSHIVIFHFHPDHVSDLIPWMQNGAWSRIDPRTKDLNIFGPVGITKMVQGMIALFSEKDLVRDHYKVNTIEMDATFFEIGSHRLEFVDLPPCDNHGIKFQLGQKTYALTGDAQAVDSIIKFLSNADVAVIDAGHISDQAIIEIASKSKVPYLICSHIYRELDLKYLNTVAKQLRYSGQILLGHDLFDLNELFKN